MTNNLTDKTLEGKYHIIKRLGHGGMGEVWLANDLHLKRQVAIKRILPTFVQNQAINEAFINEAHKMAELEHRHILPIHSYGSDPLCPAYLVMKLAECSLADKLKTAPLSLEQSKIILKQVCEALEYAHQRKIIHIDLKPANILFDNHNQILVSDFGLARAIEKTSHVSLSQQVGAIEYMPPEQFFADKAGAYSDIYSLGITLHEMLTGKIPEKGRVNKGEFIVICDDTLLPQIKDIIKKVTQDDPNARYRSAKDLALAFSSVEVPTVIIAPTPTRYEQIISRVGINPLNKVNQAIELGRNTLGWSPQSKANEMIEHGNAYRDRNDDDRAIAKYTEAINIKDDLALAYYRRGCAYHYGKQDYDNAERDYSKAIELNPDYGEAYFQRGMIYLEKETYDHVIGDLGKAIELKPRYIPESHIYLTLGIAYYGQGQDNQAITHLSTAIQLKSDDAFASSAYTYRAQIYNDKADYNQAIADCNEAIRLNPLYDEPYFQRGIAYKRTYEKEKAIADIEQFKNLAHDAQSQQKAELVLHELSEMTAKWSKPVRPY